MSFDWIKRLDEIFPRDGEYIEPLSERWIQARRGRLTASSAAYPIKVYGKAIVGLRDKLMAQMQDDYEWAELDLPALRWGRDYEKAALASIDLKLGTELVEPGTLFHPEFPFCSATPDGLIDGHISVQIKCPHKAAIHLETLYGKPLKPLYANQVQWEAWVSGADQILFASFDPEQPLSTRLYLREIPVDRELFGLFERHVKKFRNYLEGRGSHHSTVTPIGIPELF